MTADAPILHSQFAPEQRERFARQLVLPEWGPEAQAALANTSMLVVGVGGLGAPVVSYLAGVGLGRLTLVDPGTVRRADLHRQILYRTEDIGKPKVEVAARHVQAVDPNVAVTTHTTTFRPENGLELVRGHDVVIDATDNPASRYLVSDACVLEGTPLVFGAVSRLEGQVARLVRDRSPEGHLQPAPCYRCLHPAAPPPDSVPSCAEAGILGPAAGVIGAWIAIEALRIASGTLPEAPQALLHLDLGQWRTQRIQVERNRSCAACGEQPVIRELVLDEAACLSGDPFPG